MNTSGCKKRELTRSRLVAAALQLFEQRGFEGTTMRAVAAEAGLSLGAAYYYFGSKDELVLAFYQSTSAEARQAHRNLLRQSRSFQSRLRALIEFRLQQLEPNRQLVKVLARHGADFDHPLSPFSQESAPMRAEALELIESAIDGSSFRCARGLRPYVARLLWLYQLGITLFWANDASRNQERTERLLSVSMSALLLLLRLSALPLLAPLNRMLTKIITVVLESAADRRVAVQEDV